MKTEAGKKWKKKYDTERSRTPEAKAKAKERWKTKAQRDREHGERIFYNNLSKKL